MSRKPKRDTTPGRPLTTAEILELQRRLYKRDPQPEPASKPDEKTEPEAAGHE